MEGQEGEGKGEEGASEKEGGEEGGEKGRGGRVSPPNKKHGCGPATNNKHPLGVDRHSSPGYFRGAPARRSGQNSKFRFREVLFPDPQNIRDNFHRRRRSSLGAQGSDNVDTT